MGVGHQFFASPRGLAYRPATRHRGLGPPNTSSAANLTRRSSMPAREAEKGTRGSVVNPMLMATRTLGSRTGASQSSRARRFGCSGPQSRTGGLQEKPGHQGSGRAWKLEWSRPRADFSACRVGRQGLTVHETACTGRAGSRRDRLMESRRSTASHSSSQTPTITALTILSIKLFQTYRYPAQCS